MSTTTITVPVAGSGVSAGAARRARWHEARQKGIGGSDCAAVLNMHPWKSALRLYYEKTGEIPIEDHETEAMYWGSALESAIAAGYMKRTGRKMRRQPMKASTKYPFMLANIDRQIIGEARGPGIWEGKNVNAYTKLVDVRDVPDHYYLQGQHYMAVYGYEWCSFALLVGGNKLVYFDVGRDNPAIEMLIDAEGEFWRRVTLGDPPPVDGSEDCRVLMNSMRPDNVRETYLSEAACAAAIDLVAVKATIKEAETRKTQDENIIKMELGSDSCTVGIVPSLGKVIWSQDKPGQRLDAGAFREAHPDLYPHFLKEQAGAIKLRVALAKE